MLRQVGSIPIITDFKRILGTDALMLGLALPDDNPHSPNEKFSLDAFAKGMRMGRAAMAGIGFNVGQASRLTSQGNATTLFEK